MKKEFTIAKKYPFEVVGTYKTATAAAKDLGVSIKSVCRWINGEVVPKDYVVIFAEDDSSIKVCSQ